MNYYVTKKCSDKIRFCFCVVCVVTTRILKQVKIVVRMKFQYLIKFWYGKSGDVVTLKDLTTGGKIVS